MSDIEELEQMIKAVNLEAGRLGEDKFMRGYAEGLTAAWRLLTKTQEVTLGGQSKG